MMALTLSLAHMINLYGYGMPPQVQLNGHTYYIMSVAFSHDGIHIVSGSYDKSAWVWDVSTGKKLQQLNGHTGPVTSVAFSHDDIHIVSGSHDKSVRVWDASTGTELQQLNGHSRAVKSVAFSHDGIHIVSGSNDKSVRVWDASTGAELQQLNGHSQAVNSVAFSHDGNHIVSGSEDRSVRVWDASDITFIWNRKHHGVLWISTVDGWIVSLPDKNRLLWMPQGIREVLYHPYNTLIISQQGYAHVDFQGCNVGTKWAECYKPLCV